MASYFGEVILPSSRAFWNDDDGDEDNDESFDPSQENARFTINWISPEPPSFDQFVVIESDMVNDFADACLLKNAKLVCTIGCESEKSNSKIYSLNNLHLCSIGRKFNLAQAGQLTEILGPLLGKSVSVVALTSDHVSHYKSDEETDSPSFLRALHSSRARSRKPTTKVSTLHQPNIATGVCAGVLSYTEMNNLNGVMYILYTDTFALDSKAALPLEKLFSELMVGETIPNYTSTSTAHFNKGNLYL